MEHKGRHKSRHGIGWLGLEGARTAYWNLSPAVLYEEAVRRGEGGLSAQGALVTRTGHHTGRSPKDKFLVEEPETRDQVWWGEVNRPIRLESFDRILERMRSFAAGRDLFVFDGYAGADPAYELPVRIVTQYAWHNLFARNMFREETDPEALESFEPRFTVLDLPGCQAEPEEDETHSPTFVLVGLDRRLILIGGTEYAGEIKKSVFSVMNHLLPERNVLPMHCSCNYGDDSDDVALFFGLSGTGKTTLSSDSERTLIGDDEHGWGDRGVFNFEGGCYAKVIRLSAEGEPEIWDASHRFGTILENVVVHPDSRRIDFDADTHTENTRASYPLASLDNVDLAGRAGHPEHVIFLTADAFGVLPPISRLTPEQAMYHFLTGYTAKVAGTERGVTEPRATFSACFGAPFLPRHPSVYAEMLGRRLQKHGSRVWLVNTGWTGGPYGTGSRIELAYTRRMVRAALGGELDETETRTDPVFGLAVPVRVEGVPERLLRPRETWSDPEDYDRRARDLAGRFREHFEPFADHVDEAVRAAGPEIP